MAKKLDTSLMDNDFGLGEPKKEGAEQQTEDRVAEIRRRRRNEARKKLHISVYMTPAQYEMLDKVAQKLQRPLTWVAVHGIEKLYAETFGEEEEKK